MALNPLQLQLGGLPAPLPGELFILQRKGIHFKVEGVSDIGVTVKLDAKGVFYMSALRIVFVTVPPPPADAMGPGGYVLRAFELPYVNIWDEKFNQPIFGANNLSGTVQSLSGGGLQGSAKFKLTFNEGGVGTFLPIFFNLMAQAHRRLANDTQFVQAVSTGNLVSQAFVDPNDPSVLYLTQPFPAAPPAAAFNPTPAAPPPVAAVPGYAPQYGVPPPQQHLYPPPPQAYQPPTYYGQVPADGRFLPQGQFYPAPAVGYQPYPMQQNPPPGAEPSLFNPRPQPMPFH